MTIGPRAAARRREVAVCLLIVATLGLLTYAPTLRAPFLSDDFRLKFLLDAGGRVDWGLVLRQFATGWVDWPNHYRPIFGLSLAIDLQLWGLRPFGFRLTNLLLHLANALVLFLVLRRLGARAWAAHVGAALFTVHALHPEAVAWVMGRGDPLATLFYLLAVLAFMANRQEGARGGLPLALACTGLAFLAKESAFSLPVVLLTSEALSPGEGRARRILRSGLAFLALVAAYAVLRRYALGTFVGGYPASAAHSVWALPVRALNALARTLVPMDLAAAGLPLYHTVLLLLGASCLLLTVWNLRDAPERRASALFLLGWFFLSLAPFYRLDWLTENLEGARWFYLPSAAFAGFVAVVLSAPAAPRRRAAGAVLLVVLVAVHGVLLVANIRPWAEAARITRRIQAEVAGVRAALGGAEFALVNIPDQHRGASISAGLYFGLEPPFVPGPASPRLVFLGSDDLRPDRYWPLRHLLARQAIPVFGWDGRDERLTPRPPAELLRVGESPPRPPLTLVGPADGEVFSLRGPEPVLRFVPGRSARFRIDLATDFVTGEFFPGAAEAPIGPDGSRAWTLSRTGVKWTNIRILEGRALLWRVVAIDEEGQVVAESPVRTLHVAGR